MITCTETLLECINREIVEVAIHQEITEQFQEFSEFESNMLAF